MSCRQYSPRGINPKLKWKYERDDLFNQAAANIGKMVFYSSFLYVLVKLFAA
jgi:hypothetical protein